MKPNISKDLISQETAASSDKRSREPGARDGDHGFEEIHLALILKEISKRLSKLEKAGESKKKSSIQDNLLELLRILVGGWPAFGIILLIFFYSPIRDAIKSIPERVRQADEIQFGSFSLKSTIKAVAASEGLLSIGEQIPNLSGESIKHLLRAPGQPTSLVSFTTANEPGYSEAINYPADSFVRSLEELEAIQLIEISGGLADWSSLSGGEISELIAEIKAEFPGRQEDNSYRDFRARWILDQDTHRDRTREIKLTWKLSTRGEQAVELVLKAVSAELAPHDG